MSHYAHAVHEAGHAVVGLLLGLDLRSVEVYADGGGITVFRTGGDAEATAPPPTVDSRVEKARVESRAERMAAIREDPARFDDFLRVIRSLVKSDADVLNHLIVTRAGAIAQAQVSSFESAIWGASDDRLTEDLLICCLDDPARMARFDSRSRALAAWYVESNWEAIVDVASHLIVSGRLEGHEVRAILGGRLGVESRASEGGGVGVTGPSGASTEGHVGRGDSLGGGHGEG